jgi:hypothetical protein
VGPAAADDGSSIVAGTMSSGLSPRGPVALAALQRPFELAAAQEVRRRLLRLSMA